MKAIGIIQARMGSTRLPGKILAPIINGQTLLAVLSRRLAPAGIDWWLATGNQRSDDVTAAWGEELNMKVFRGDEEDVLSRFVAIVRRTEPEWIVRVTADDPFMEGKMVRQLLAAAADAPHDVDLIGEVPPDRQFPLGYLPQVVRSTALLRIDSEIPRVQCHDRSHVTSLLIPDRAETYVDHQLPHRPFWRWTVDTVDDLRMVRAVFATLGTEWSTVDYTNLVELLDHRPDIVAINAYVQQKAIRDG